MKLGIMGGSFNPVHLGHLILAEKALEDLKLDRIVMIPAFISPFKSDAENTETSPAHRLEMLASAVASDTRFAVDDCEINRQGFSYTVDTLEDIIARYMPDGKPYLIIGDDLIHDFLNWKNSQRILELANIAAGRREKISKEKLPFPCYQLNNDIINISSTGIRQLIQAGKNWQSLVPQAVRDIIADNGLYGYKAHIKNNSKDASFSKISAIEAAVRQRLSTRRFIHSRSTALLAYDLCCRFDLAPKAGYLAGIAHDICKEIDVQEMLNLAKKDGNKITELEKKKLNLLHGRAGAVYLKTHFDIQDKDILEAIAVHTAGTENMGNLAKIVYIADKAEVTRNIDNEYRKIVKNGTLDSILYATLKRSVLKLQSKNLEVSDDIIKHINKLKGKGIENI